MDQGYGSNLKILLLSLYSKYFIDATNIGAHLPKRRKK